MSVNMSYVPSVMSRRGSILLLGHPDGKAALVKPATQLCRLSQPPHTVSSSRNCRATWPAFTSLMRAGRRVFQDRNEVRLRDVVGRLDTSPGEGAVEKDDVGRHAFDQGSFDFVASRPTFISSAPRTATARKIAALSGSRCGLRDGVFGSLDRAALDDLASRLGLENRRLLREGIDALALFCGRLPHDYHADEAGNDEDAVLLQLDVTDGGYGLDDSLHVLAGELVIELVGNLLDQIGLGQGAFGHFDSFRWCC